MKKNPKKIKSKLIKIFRQTHLFQLKINKKIYLTTKLKWNSMLTQKKLVNSIFNTIKTLMNGIRINILKKKLRNHIYQLIYLKIIKSNVQDHS